MKKKGLIIATIVMVLVLAVSLTTATYAWFTASNVTMVEGFDFAVKGNNIIDIGVKTTPTHELPSNVTRDSFKTGAITYTPGTAGVLGGGSWEGDTGMSASIDHNILWGQVSSAVGATFVENSTTASQYDTIATKANAKTNSDTLYIYSANATSTAGTLTTPTAAIANYRTDGAQTPTQIAADYVYLFLGATPTKALSSNELIILIDANSSTGTTVGMLGAITVAYRVTKANAESVTSTWSEATIFSNSSLAEGTLASGTQLSACSAKLTAEEQATYNTTYGQNAYKSTKTAAFKITGLSTDIGAIDQIELVVYLDGTNTTFCNNSGLNAGGSIKVFFHAVEQGA